MSCIIIHIYEEELKCRASCMSRAFHHTTNVIFLGFEDTCSTLVIMSQPSSQQQKKKKRRRKKDDSEKCLVELNAVWIWMRPAVTQENDGRIDPSDELSPLLNNSSWCAASIRSYRGQ